MHLLSEILRYPHALILAIIGGLLMLAQLAVIFVASLTKSEKGASAVHQLAVVLSVLTPVVVVLLMITGVHRGRVLPLEAMGMVEPGQKAMMLAHGTAIVFNQRIVAGAALCLSAALGMAGLVLAQRARSRHGDGSLLPLVGGLGICLAGGAFGWGIVKHAVMLIRGFGALANVDAIDKTTMFTRLISELPSLCVSLVLALIFMAVSGIAFVALAARAKQRAPAGLAVAVSLLILLFGAGAYVATRAHAADYRSLPGMLQQLKSSGGFLYPVPNVQTPRLDHATPLENAPVIIVGDGRVVVEGEMVARISDLIADDNPQIPGLAEHLGTLKTNFQVLHPQKKFPSLIALQADVNSPGQAIVEVLRTCHSQGYQRGQLVAVGVQIIESAVLGKVHRTLNQAVQFELTDQHAPAALELPRSETYGQWAKMIDAAAGKAAVLVRVVDQQPDQGSKQ